MPRQRFVLIQVASLFVVSALCEAAAAAPSPEALLRGVEAARGKYDSLRVTLEIRHISPGPAKTIECLVEMVGERRRFEVFEGEVTGQVIIRDGDEFHSYRRKSQEDVHVYDVREATGVRGDVAFDPRALGFDDNMSCALTVRVCLWYENNESLQVVGRESLGGISLWRVKAVRKNSEGGEYWSEYWIEEPSFRLHRRITETPLQRIEVNSEFDADDSTSPFPSRVTATRTFLKDDRKYERTYLVKKFDLGANIPSDRFTLKSMDLPLNTAVVDYRISRRIGFWNGEGLSENPIYEGERPAEPSAPESQVDRRFWVYAINLLVVAVVAALIVWIRRRRAPK